jgi:hypothetical protein
MYNYGFFFCFSAVEVAVVAHLRFGLNLDDDSSPAAAGGSSSGSRLTMYFCGILSHSCSPVVIWIDHRKSRERRESVIDGHSGWASQKCCSMLYVQTAGNSLHLSGNLQCTQTRGRLVDGLVLHPVSTAVRLKSFAKAQSDLTWDASPRLETDSEVHAGLFGWLSAFEVGVKRL